MHTSFRRSLSFLCFGSLLLFAFRASGQIQPLLSLDTGWEIVTDSGLKAVSLPYTRAGENEAHFQLGFCMPDIPAEDTLFLYFEGLAWEAEVLLGDAYLGISDHPLSEWILPVPVQLNHAGDWDTLQLDLGSGPSPAWYPEAFIGILHPPLVLDRADIRKLSVRILPLAIEQDTIAVVAPFYRRQGYAFDLFEAVRNLQPAIDAGINQIYFPFPPDRKMRELCARLGFSEVLQLEDSSQICLINSYPFAAQSFPSSERFWLDQQAVRTEHYGEVIRLKSTLSTYAGKESSNLGLILILLFPVLCLFLLKLLNPGFFYGQPALLLDPKLHLANSLDATSSNTGLLGILMLFKGLNLSMVISLLLYYVMRENQWEQLNLIRDWSLLNQWFYGRSSLWQIFIRSVELVSYWSLLKYAILAVLGWGFRIKNLLEGIMGIEVASSYPLILFIGLPLGLVLFMDTLWGGWFITFFFLLLLLYIIRRTYVFFIGLERLFSFSSGVKFLYICALNLIPYLIWF